MYYIYIHIISLCQEMFGRYFNVFQCFWRHSRWLHQTVFTAFNWKCASKIKKGKRNRKGKERKRKTNKETNKIIWNKKNFYNLLSVCLFSCLHAELDATVFANFVPMFSFYVYPLFMLLCDCAFMPLLQFYTFNSILFKTIIFYVPDIVPIFLYLFVWLLMLTACNT